MATPKLDRIIFEFCRRIGVEPSYSSGTTLSSTLGHLTDDEVVSYVNKAMFKMFNDYWQAVNGDEDEFIRIFPELVVTENVAFNSAEVVTISAIQDMFIPIDGQVSSTYVKKLPANLYNTLLAERLPNYTPSITDPAMIYIGGGIKLFPNDFYETGARENIDLTYIKQPLNPTDGSFLTQDGSYDSPFNNQWNSQIAEIAELIYRKESQEEI